MFMILWGKLFFRISRRAPFLKILRECPLVTLFFLKCIRFWHTSGSCFFVRILNISIKSPRSLLHFKVGNLSFLILSSYVKSLKPGMSLVARLWTFSITSTWRLSLGAQTELAYSKCGLTNALYRRIWLAIPAIITVSLRVLKYVTRCVFEVTRYVIHVTRNLNYVTRFLS